MASKKRGYYAVAKGRNTAIYDNWNSCSEQVNGYSGARYKRFDTKSEAEAFINRESGSSSAKSQESSYRLPSSSKGGSHSSSSRYFHTQLSSNTTSDKSRQRQTSNDYIPLHLGYRSIERSSKLRKLSAGNTERIFVDGACRGNGRAEIPSSGYGVYYGQNSKRNAAISLADVDNIYKNKPSNQRAELFGVKHALRDVADLVSHPKYDGRKFEIHTDSKYSKNCIEKWCKEWEKNDWKTSGGTPAKNLDIIKDAHKVYRKLKRDHPGSISFVHVKGHLGIEGNEAADQLANKGADKMFSQIRR